MVKTDKVMGKVVYNSGEWAQIVTFYDDGINRGFLSEIFQICSDEANVGTDEFQQKFRVGTLLDITNTIEITPTSKTCDLVDIDRAVDEILRGCESDEI